MQIQIGKFTGELSLDDRGEVQAQWLPCQSRYLTSGGREQCQADCEAFLERVSVSPGPIVNVVDRLSSAD
jgi:hypothetical protein